MIGKERSVIEVQEHLKDITKCYVCSETYKDPKILPCIHTFCMKCLEETGGKTSKSLGDQMPCPICKKKFAIPEDGYAALQKNFFMEKLIEMAKTAGSSESPDLCEACMGESEATSSEVPLADMYCIECPQKLCQECSRHHRKNKLTRNHQVVAAVDFQGSVETLVTSYCEKHSREHMLYCSDCRELLCKFCFGEGHQNHRLQNVGIVVEGFKNEIQNSLGSIEVCESEVYEKKENLRLEKEEYRENLENLKLEILAQRDATIELINEHANLLVQEIDSLKEQKLEEVQAEIEDTELYLTCLESFKVYCTEILKKGSASDICYTIDKLKARAEEIKEQHEPEVEIRSRFPKMSFRMSDLKEFVRTEDYNIIGNIQGCQTEAEGGDETRISSNKSSRGVDIKMEDGCSRPISGNSSILSQIKPLNEELENERLQVRGLEIEKETLEKQIGELEKELGVKGPKFTFSKPADLRSLMEAESEDETNISSNKSSRGGDIKMEDNCARPVSGKNGILAQIKQLNRELENERLRVRGLEIEKETLEKRISELKVELGIKRPKFTFSVPRVVPREISIDYRRIPRLVKMLDTLEGGRSIIGDEICGLTILDDELFLGGCVIDSVVEVYNIKTFNFKRRWRVERSLAPGFKILIASNIRISCMSSCTTQKCLYVCIYSSRDFLGFGVIQKTDVYGLIAKDWKIDVGAAVLNISVVGDGNIIVTNYDKNTLNEYSRDGQLVREVKLSWSLGIEHPLHALKLANGHFVVSHGLGYDHFQRVLVVSESGQITKSFGGMLESGEVSKPKPLNEPVFLAVDRLGNILVADRGNNRVVVLNSNLEFVASINPCLSLQKPSCICVDMERSLVFICEDKRKVSVYDFSDSFIPFFACRVVSK